MTQAVFVGERLSSGAPEEEKKLSTGVMVGIWTAILATGGTIFYLTTRKVTPRRRAAA